MAQAAFIEPALRLSVAEYPLKKGQDVGVEPLMEGDPVEASLIVTQGGNRACLPLGARGQKDEVSGIDDEVIVGLVRQRTENRIDIMIA